MRPLVTRHSFIRLAVAAATLLAVACQPAAPPAAPTAAPAAAAKPTEAPKPAAQPTTAPAAAAKPAEAAKPTTGTSLVIAIQGDPQNLDPATTSGSPPAIEIINNVYRNLVAYKIGTGPKGEARALNEFVPDLAESWTVTEGGTRVTFKMRPGGKFANGDPLDAHAVKYTYDRVFGLKTTTASLMDMAKVTKAESVRVVDDMTVEFTLDKANELFFPNAVIYSHGILNPKVVKPHETAADPFAREWLKANTTGTESGPYVLESQKPGVEYVLTRNPNYHGTPAKTERIVLRVVPDASARLTLIKSGAVDGAKAISLKDLASLESDTNVSVVRNPSIAVSYLGLNTKVPPFDNPKVRQAVAQAIPYETIVKEALVGYGQPLSGPVPLGMPTKTEEVTVYKTDAVKAKALLAEAGFPQGIKVTLSVRSELAEAKAVGVWVKSEAAKAGIDVTINEMQSAPFAAALTKKELEFFHYPHWASSVNDPFFHYFWHFTDSCCNWAQYSNPEVMKLVDEFLINPDAQGRAAASRKVQAITSQDAAWVPLYQVDDTFVLRKNVKGLVLYPDPHFYYSFLAKD
jgi:peptide/nickel transport system substrate-binding protein